jgi:hypothetical protein
MQGLKAFADKMKGETAAVCVCQLARRCATQTKPHPKKLSLTADKAAEIKAEIVEAAHTPALHASAPTSLVGQLASDSTEVARAATARQLGLHVCGHDIEGVSIAGQVGKRIGWSQLVWVGESRPKKCTLTQLTTCL